jgi:predicted O-methyltransferase YrrM
MQKKQQLREKAINLILKKLYTDDFFSSERSTKTAISYNQGLFLKKMLQEEQPKSMIELGFHYGFSSLWLFAGSYDSLEKYIIVDPWIPSKKNLVAQFLKQDSRVVFVKNLTSQEYLASILKTYRRQVDCIIIDADEKFDGVMTDLYFSLHLIRINGLITVRNTWNPSVRKALLFFLKNLPLRLEGVPWWAMWLVRNLPVGSGWLLRYLVGNMDFCTMRLIGEENRNWDHFKEF